MAVWRDLWEMLLIQIRFHRAPVNFARFRKDGQGIWMIRLQACCSKQKAAPEKERLYVLIELLMR